MKFHWLNLLYLRRVIGVCLLSAPLLVACAKEKSTLAVNLHGVNYTADPFSYSVADPTDPKNSGGGELIDPYGAGGTSCCFELPKKWRAGIKVEIQSTHWLGKAADNSLHEIVEKRTVEVPPYPDGKPGELWVLRVADGTTEVVSSDVQPDHLKWPGKVKGWPVPSLAYQRERWDIDIDHQAGSVVNLKILLQRLEASPDYEAQDTWNHSLEHDKESLIGYSGPQDIRYRKKLKREYEEGLEQTKAILKRLKQGRP